MFSYDLPLCKLLQKIGIDLKEAVDLAEEANITTMQYLHENIGEEFKKLFREAEVKIKTNVLPINYYMHLLF